MSPLLHKGRTPKGRAAPSEAEFFRLALKTLIDGTGHGIQRKIADQIDKSPTYLNDIVHGRSRGSLPTRQRIAQALGLSYEEMVEQGRTLQALEAESGSVVCRGTEFMTVPLVRARLSGGDGSFETEGDVVGYYAFRADFLLAKGRPESMVLFKVSGHSMSPVLNNGDVVMVDQNQNEVVPGHIYAVGIDDTVVVKRIEIEPGVLLLKSENPDYGQFEVPLHEQANVRVIGRVIWSAREY